MKRPFELAIVLALVAAALALAGDPVPEQLLDYATAIEGVQIELTDRYHQRELCDGVTEPLPEHGACSAAFVPGRGSIGQNHLVIIGADLDHPGEGFLDSPDCEFQLLEPGAPRMLLERFEVAVRWTSGELSGEAAGIPFGCTSMLYSFFSVTNVELIVKVLDACGDPDFNTFWVFAAGLTNVGVEIIVTDTATGAVKLYESTEGVRFDTILDVGAFACP